MVVVFIVQTTERPSVTIKVKEEKILNAFDRCDSCGSQAYVKVTGMSGELTFCGHHYSKIISSDSSKKSLEDFAYEVVDEREFK
jgi:hypothetical protein